MICPKCNSINGDSSSTCSVCGSSLLPNTSQPSPIPTPPPVISNQVQPENVTQPINVPIAAPQQVQASSNQVSQYQQNFTQGLPNPQQSPQANYGFQQQDLRNISSSVINQQSPIEKSVLNPNTDQVNQPDKKKSKLPFIIILIIMVCIIGIVFFILSKKGNLTEKNGNTEYSAAFFIEENHKYALFNDKGEQLTGFDFDYVSDFRNKTAAVEQDDKTAIINTKGKFTVNFDKFDDIDVQNYLYSARKGDKDYLIDASGRIIYDISNASVSGYLGNEKYVVVTDKQKKVFKIINHKGKEIFSQPFSSEEDKIEKVSYKSDNYLSIFYKNKTYIFDLNNGKQLATFEDHNRYCIFYVSNDKKVIGLNSCVAVYETAEEHHYKLIINGKIENMDDKCDQIYEAHDLICKKDGTSYLLTNKYEKGIALTDTDYIDNKNYAIEKEDSNRNPYVEFYTDGKLVKTVSCRRIGRDGYVNSNYILKVSCRENNDSSYGKDEYYTKDGQRIGNDVYKKTTLFDENGFATVSQDGEKYYLINSKGEKVTDEYDSIIQYDKNYSVLKNDKYGLLDNKGKKLIDTIYKSMIRIEKNDSLYYMAESSNSEYVILDKNMKELFKLPSEPKYNEHYLYITKEGKTQYYSYNGKMFYESSK